MQSSAENAQCLREKSDLQFAALFDLACSVVCRGMAICLLETRRAGQGPEVLAPSAISTEAFLFDVSTCMCSSLLCSRSRRKSFAGRVNRNDSVFQLPASGFDSLARLNSASFCSEPFQSTMLAHLLRGRLDTSP